MLLRSALMLACAAALASAVPAAARPDAGRSCGVFTDRAGARIVAVVLRGATLCSTTKRVLRTYMNSAAPCTGSACVRRHFGWTCATAAAHALPRLASCTRGRARIGAYVTAD